MLRLIKAIITALALTLFAAGPAFAADNLSVKLEQPKSPTNRQDFSLTFVALDVLERPITVRCYQKGPGDGGYSLFDTDYNLPAGGDTAACKTNSGVVSGEGNYEFYVTATADAETVSSSAVSVEYRVSGPGTPSYQGKDQHALCQYKIKFKTADDGGETVKIEIYRSENISFNANGDTRVGTVGIGSNTEGSYIDTVPDCGKTYYYAIRAFNDAGTGSSVVGDTTTVTTYTETGTTTGAIPVGSGGSISGGGQTEATGEETPAGEVLGEEAADAEAETEAEEETGSFLSGLFQNKIVAVIIILLLLGLGSYLVFGKKA